MITNHEEFVVGSVDYPIWLLDMLRNGEMKLEHVQTCKSICPVKKTETIKKVYRVTTCTQSAIVFEGSSLQYRYNTKNQVSDVEFKDKKNLNPESWGIVR